MVKQEVWSLSDNPTRSVWLACCWGVLCGVFRGFRQKSRLWCFTTMSLSPGQGQPSWTGLMRTPIVEWALRGLKVQI